MHVILHRYVPVLLAGVLISACGGESTSVNPVTSITTTSNYTGPAALTADVQAFRLNVWENLNKQNRCGACHGTGGQSPAFVRMDDINLAYARPTAS